MLLFSSSGYLAVFSCCRELHPVLSALIGFVSNRAQQAHPPSPESSYVIPERSSGGLSYKLASILPRPTVGVTLSMILALPILFLPWRIYASLWSGWPFGTYAWGGELTGLYLSPVVVGRVGLYTSLVCLGRPFSSLSLSAFLILYASEATRRETTILSPSGPCIVLIRSLLFSLLFFSGSLGFSGSSLGPSLEPSFFS